MKVSDFDFDLPDEAIALRPAQPRDHARLLCLSDNGEISDRHVYDLPNRLRAGDVLVFNQTQVFRAALTGIRPARAVGGGGDVTITVNLHKSLSEGRWRAFVKPAKRLRIDDRIMFSKELTASVTQAPIEGDCELSFNLTGDALMKAINQVGEPPIPPYIARQRAADARDAQDYQTVYARESGSVAAPTAGLHFTENLLDDLRTQGVQLEYLTLHVGAGTFLPVKTDDTRDHAMHSEWYSISENVADRINTAKSEGRRIIAVGTTSLRSLESAAQRGLVKAGSDDTDIFITPGYEFQIVDGLMTNFHLPKSTLFMLVSALCGLERMQNAYRHAIETGYRFYSYGDSSLLWKAK